jgi:hypothetical protein
MKMKIQNNPKKALILRLIELAIKAFAELSTQQTALPYGHWTIDENKNIRGFFDSLARFLSLDPLIAENWYHVTRKHVLSQKVLFFFKNKILKH